MSGKVKFRPAVGSLAEAMAKMIEVSSIDEIAEAFNAKPGAAIFHIRPEHVSVEDYECSDHRVGWDRVYIVTENNHGRVTVLGFTDGPL